MSSLEDMEAGRDYGKLALALSKAQAVMKAAHKDASNPFFKSKYATLASVWDACREALTANELAVVQFPYSEGAIVGVRTVIIHSSGQWMEGRCGAVPKDASPQAVGSCITYLRRYGLASVVGVCPEDDDGQEAQPARSQEAPRPKYEAYPAKREPKDSDMVTKTKKALDKVNHSDGLEVFRSRADKALTAGKLTHAEFEQIVQAIVTRSLLLNPRKTMDETLEGDDLPEDFGGEPGSHG